MDYDTLKAHRALLRAARMASACPRTQAEREAKAAVEDFLSPLRGEDLRLMRLRYLDGYRWEEIADKLYYTLRTLHTKHRRILRRLGVVMGSRAPA